jgi:hypothetical protein
MDKYKHKSGCQKLAAKRKKELLDAGKDPKQRKLIFPEQSTPSQGTSAQHQDTSTPSQGTSAQHQDTSTPSQGTSAQHQDTSTPSQGTSAQHQETSTPSQGTSAQRQDTSTPSQGTTQEPSSKSVSVTPQGMSAGTRDSCSGVSNLQKLHNETEDSCYFIPPLPSASQTEKYLFVKRHPVQPENIDEFNEKRVYNRLLTNGDSLKRQWLSFNKKTKKIHCSVCMAFSSDRDCPFVSGFMCDKRHIYDRIEKHEKSQNHERSSNAYLHLDTKQTIDTLFNSEVESLKKRRRLILERIIEIILFIARQAIPYRGKEETASSLSQSFEQSADVNCGNFLALVLLLSKYDDILKSHVQDCITTSQLREGTGTSGRGRTITLLSKQTVNKILHIIADIIKQTISNEVKECGKFGIQIDSTQDIGIIDQLAICLRYVKEGKPMERMISLVDVPSSTSETLFSAVSESLQNVHLDLKNIVGHSFDGAANMSGKYNGLQAKIKEKAPGSIFVHCYAHRFNLVMSDTTSCCIECKNFFGLLEATAVFIRESHKRIQEWKDVAQKNDNSRQLKIIGETRWTSKDLALDAIIGGYSRLCPERLVHLIEVLNNIASNQQFDNGSSFRACVLKEKWSSFSTILTAVTFSRLFQICTPVSKYLQTSGLSISSAANMVNTALSQLKTIRNAYEETVETAEAFTLKCNDMLDEKGIDIIEPSLPVKRIGQKKATVSEAARDERQHILSCPKKSFQVIFFY